ncbi:MAG: sigma-70 family RNA polymerase sigma factor [Candidatus Solibacter sp.]
MCAGAAGLANTISGLIGKHHTGYRWTVDSTHETMPGCDPSVAADLALVTAVLQRDRKATAEFVESYADAIYAFVRRRLTPRYDLVDDVVQDVFLAAWESLSKFRGTSPLKAWLLGIARHKVEDHYRKLLRAADQLDTEVVEVLPAAKVDLEQIADQERTEQRARAVLEDLPEQYSAALQWRYWEKRSARQMAEATGRTEKGIERLLSRARDEFRRRWTE